MHQRSAILALLLSTLVIIGITHVFALYLKLYFLYPWIDIPMHILGGASVAFFILLTPYSSLRISKEYTTLMPILTGVLIVGLAWELFEISIGIPLIETEFEIDMLGDLGMDLLGGGIGYFVGRSIEAL